MSELARTLHAQPLRRFKPYPACKDSGIEWLGDIPAHWEVKRLKTLAAVQLSNVDKKSVEGQEPVRLCNYTDVYYNERITADLEFMAATATREQVRRFALRAGDVLITKDSESWTDIAVPAVVSEDLPDVLCGYHLAHIRPADGIVGAFLSRAFSAVGPRDQFHVAANGITRFGLGGDAIRVGVFAMPPEPEQRAIAAFLDRETARIDALVAKKERLIELLQEKRTALITRAVTKGLDPSVPMKDSGVEWLGEIPAHWEVKRLWHLTPSRRRIMYGIVLPGPNVQDGVPLVKGGDVSPERLRLDRLNRVSREIEAGYARSRLRGGDLVYAIRGSIGEVAMVPDELTGANITQDAARIAYTSETYGPWLLYALRSRAAFAQLEAGALGAAIRGINIRDLKRASLAVPPPDEQRAIADFLDRETSRIDALITKVRDAIDRLKELRTALISAAVTGKIDVREEAA
ncbi:MAG: restriction endonuclease subunit S [Gemmatimonadaceae bacterium]|nr:restriction endonuclease subunit S [Gemmatimonadaceae bacterium]